MKVTTERLPDARVVLEVEADPERVERSLDQAYRRLVGRLRVPGFRPGKAPRAVVERYVGQGALLQEALDRLVPELYKEAAEQEGIEPIDQPDFEITSLEPVIFKATVPVRPSVDIGDYESLRIEPQPAEISDEEVQEALEELRQRYAYLQPVDRPLQSGDTALCDIIATDENGREVVRDEETEFVLNEDHSNTVPGFDEAITGMRPGEQREFTLTVPDNDEDPDLAGRTLTYRVTLHEVKEEKLPDLSDDFARRVGEGFATLSLLRERLRSDLQEARQGETRRRDEERALDALVAQSQVEFPEVMLDREIDRLVGGETGSVTSASDIERQLQRIGKSPEELREEVREDAEERLRRSLVLSEFANRAGVAVTPEDVDAEIARMAEGLTEEQAEQLRQIFNTENGREIIARSLFTKKALDHLRRIALAEPEAAAEADVQRKSPRTAPRSLEESAVEEPVIGDEEESPGSAGES